MHIPSLPEHYDLRYIYREASKDFSYCIEDYNKNIVRKYSGSLKKEEIRKRRKKEKLSRKSRKLNRK